MAGNLNRYFFEDDTQVVNKHITKAQHHYLLGNANQNSRRYHYMPTRMAVIKKTDNNKGYYLETWESSYIVGRNVKWLNGLAALENSFN